MTTSPPHRPAAPEVTSAPYAGLWSDLVASALVGTDRRAVPALPLAPVSDLVLDARPVGAPQRLLTAVAATTAARRAGITPRTPGTSLDAVDVGPRPILAPASAEVGSAAVRRWPILEREWLTQVCAAGHRLPPDLAVAALERSRNDPSLRALALRAAGPVGHRLVEEMPSLRARPNARRADPEPASAVQLAIDAFGDDDAGVTERFTAELATSAGSRTARIAIYSAFVAHVASAATLDAIADAADAIDSDVAHSIADLARSRARMLGSLPTGGHPNRQPD